MVTQTNFYIEEFIKSQVWCVQTESLLHPWKPVTADEIDVVLGGYVLVKMLAHFLVFRGLLHQAK
jgi:hypothetical protein